MMLKNFHYSRLWHNEPSDFPCSREDADAHQEPSQRNAGSPGHDMGGMSPRSGAWNELYRSTGRGFGVSKEPGSAFWSAPGAAHLLRKFPVPLLFESSNCRATVWPSSCQTTEPWQPLAPPAYQHPDQINEPLGNEKADQLAQALGIEQDMLLTDTEYQCVMGVPPRDPAQEILYACFIDFTASKGNGIVVPFSSYGLNLNEQGNVLSLCAPHAPCLEANKVFLQLKDIAQECGFENKLERLVSETPILKFIDEGGECQAAWKPSCIAEATRSDNDNR
jgi:hypothetical protein